MKKSKKILKYCLNFDELVKEAAPPIKVPIPSPAGRFPRFKEYIFPTARNPFQATLPSGGVHFPTLLAEIKRLTYPNAKWMGGDFFQKFSQVVSLGERNGLVFDKNPNSPTYRQIKAIDPTSMVPEVLQEYQKPETQRVLRQEIQSYNQLIRERAKIRGELEGRGYSTDLSTPLGRQTWAIKNKYRAVAGTAAIAGITALYFIFSGKSPSTASKEKKQIIDETLEDPELSEIPDCTFTISQIKSLNSKLESMGNTNPVLENKLEGFIVEGEDVISALEELNPGSIDMDDPSESSAYAGSVSYAISIIKPYISTLRKLHRIMISANKQNIASKINTVIGALSQYVQAVSQFKNK